MASDGANLQPCPVEPFSATKQDMLDVLNETLADVLDGRIRGLAIIVEDSDGTTSNRYVPCDTLKLLAGCERLRHRINLAFDT